MIGPLNASIFEYQDKIRIYFICYLYTKIIKYIIKTPIFKGLIGRSPITQETGNTHTYKLQKYTKYPGFLKWMLNK